MTSPIQQRSTSSASYSPRRRQVRRRTSAFRFQSYRFFRWAGKTGRAESSLKQIENHSEPEIRCSNCHVEPAARLRHSECDFSYLLCREYYKGNGSPRLYNLRHWASQVDTDVNGSPSPLASGFASQMLRSDLTTRCVGCPINMNDSFYCTCMAGDDVSPSVKVCDDEDVVALSTVQHDVTRTLKKIEDGIPSFRVRHPPA
jgi:hypothetical protein